MQFEEVPYAPSCYVDAIDKCLKIERNVSFEGFNNPRGANHVNG